MGLESKLSGGGAVIVAIVLALFVTTWRVSYNAENASRWVAHTHELLHSLSRIRSYTLQVELATQNFRITGYETYLIARDQAIGEREQLLASLKDKLSDNKEQLVRLGKIDDVIRLRINISREIERIRKESGEAAASAYVKQAPLEDTRNSLYNTLDAMESSERSLLAMRQSAQDSFNRVLFFLEIIMGLSLVILLTGIYVFILKQFERLNKENKIIVENSERTVSILSAIGDAVIVTDVNNIITKVNSVAVDMCERKESDVLGEDINNVFICINEVGGEIEKITDISLLKGGGCSDSHFYLEQSSGNRIDISIRMTVLYHSMEEQRDIVYVLRDVTEQRHAEHEMQEKTAQLEYNVEDKTHRWQESQKHLQDMLASIPMLIAYVNSERKYVYVNEQYRLRFAPELESLSGLYVEDVLGDERYAIACPLITKALKGVAQHYDWQPFPNVWQHIGYYPKAEGEEILGYYVLGMDITELKISEARIQTLNLELSERVRELEHLSKALRTLSAGNKTMLRAKNESELLDNMCKAIVDAGRYKMAIIWFKGERQDLPIYPAAQSGFPGGMAALESLKHRLVNSVNDSSVTPRAIQSGQVQLSRNMVADPNYSKWRDQLDGAISSISCPLTVEGSVVGALTIYDSDINAFSEGEINILTESSEDLAFGIAMLRAQIDREKSRVAIQHMMRYDALTGLANVFLFEQFLSEKIALCIQTDTPVTTFQFNIERLSEINDALGFRHGDEVLCEFATRLQSIFKENAMVARIRGDEFAVALVGKDVHSALLCIESCFEILRQPYHIADLSIDVASRVGIASFPQHGEHASELLRSMSKAVYQSKRRGEQVSVFNPGLPQVEMEKLAMVGELRRAIDNKEFVLYLQPKLRLSDMQVAGAEVLIRWEHPSLGLLGPGRFIHLAEQTGLIKPLTELIVQLTLSLLNQWTHDKSLMPLAVNLSARNLRDDALPEKIISWLNEYGVNPEMLEFEITESSIMEEPEQSMLLLHAMKNVNFALYIDDYGTGYSSLKYIQQLPVDYIKIDQSFVTYMVEDESSRLIVQSTIELVKGLGRKTVAEGVESFAVLQQLKALGCDYAQGYFIAKPMPAKQFQSWVSEFDSGMLSFHPDPNHVAHR